MTNQEILTKAIEKAIAGGWKPTDGSPDDWLHSVTDRNTGHKNIYWLVIFNHDFAKALWGERLVRVREIHSNPFIEGEPDIIDTLPAWQAHLTKMVIADDPIKYLGKHI